MKKSFRDSIIAMRRFAGRLGRDVAGNTLAIVAAAIIPLAALVGSGLDMSRAYMAQARLQMACDAGALAGRRVMVASTVDQNVRDEALKFFKFNFPTGDGSTKTPYGVAAFTPTIPDATDGTVRMSASTTIPTTLMAIFGKQTIDISATCFARQDFVNTDIVLVLDTTGSMSADTSGKEQNSGPTSKIVGLRAAVLALYDELAPVQTQLETAGLRLRYGIVPYSISVNVGKLVKAQNSSYLVSNWTYQSRESVYTSNSASSAATTCYRRYGLTNCYSSSSLANGASSSSTLSANNCSKWSVNNYNSTGVNPEWTGTPPGSGTMIKTAYSYDSFNGSTSSPSGSTNRKCVRKEIATPYDSNYTGGSGFTFAEWEYKPRALDVSGYLTGTATLTPSETNGSKSTWAGCIEERDTDSSINTGTNSISSNAHDLNIDEIPSNNNNKWRPSWKEVIYLRNSASDADPTVTRIGGGTPVTNQGSDSYACPTEAKRLQAWTRSDLSTYLNSLNADGYTYHDIGMIWGGRFISPDGIFGGDNPSTYNSMPVARFIIYMTDGALNTVETGYSSYGVEYLDKRVTGGYTTSSDQDNRHNQRFALACQAAKAKGVSIWVVAFASSLSTQLQNCASKTTQASVSSDSASLIAKFAEIGKNIGSLRLTQ